MGSEKGVQGEMGREKAKEVFSSLFLSSPALLPRAQLYLCRVLYEDDWGRVSGRPISFGGGGGGGLSGDNPPQENCENLDML